MIILLSRNRQPVVDPELAALDRVEVFKAPQPGGAAGRTRPDWAGRRLDALAALLVAEPGAVVVCAQDATRPFGWRVGERFPDTPVLSAQPIAAAVLTELRHRGERPTATAVRTLLDPLRRAPTPAPAYLVDPARRPPLVVGLVGDGSERAVEAAAAVGALGLDTVLLRPAATDAGDYSIAGSAVVLEVPQDGGAERPVAPAVGSGSPGRLGAQRLRALAARVPGLRRPSAPAPASAGPTGAHDSVGQLAVTAVALRPAVLHVHDWDLLPTARAVVKRRGPLPVVLDTDRPPPQGLDALPVTPDAVVTSVPAVAEAVAGRFGIRAGVRTNAQSRAEVVAGLCPPSTSRGGPAVAEVLIGPANSAGQATAWARALTASGIPARSLEYRSPDQPFDYPADEVFSRDSVTTLDRQLQLWFQVLARYDSVIVESGKWIAAPEPGPVPPVRWGMREARALQQAGRAVGLIFHGSDLRLPEAHARSHPWSPFHDPANELLTEQLQRRTGIVHEELASWDGPVMVSTPDLLSQHPAAQWVPVVIDLEQFSAHRRSARERPAVPVVLHLPSSSALKGSGLIDPVLHRLAAEGVIRYRRMQAVAHARVPDLLAECDLVVDQLGMGILGVGALEALAAGATVVTDPGPEALAAYDEPVPVAAVTPETLEQELRSLVTDVDRCKALAAAGPGFVARHHDGRRSAQALRGALGWSADGRI